MRLIRQTVSLLTWIGCLMTLGGCTPAQLPTYPVAGRVVFPDGAPVQIGSVEFKSREHGVQARGEIDTEGRFTLSTFRQGDGAVAGHHACVVVQFIMVEDIANFQPSTEGVVDPRFGSYATSGLECEVLATDKNQVTLTVAGLVTGQPQGGSTPHDHLHAPVPASPH